MRGVRYALRNFTAVAVKEHLRSQLDRADGDALLTPREVELVRFTAERSDRLQELAAQAPHK